MKLEKNCLIKNPKSINNINNYTVNLMMVYLTVLQTKEIGYSLQKILRSMKFSTKNYL
ncbi:unnamed protein product [Paramecium sonneborni]|uniref:Uncharacterized protein n=1 Tax=Paramecium sonneborni TaxID=65129 RepID=A0A8S1RNY9_9CILI|nr:unnamed protein product [Paramecium sonneborni]